MTIKAQLEEKNEDGTALNKISLSGVYKESYKRQMDMYQWILKEKGFKVSDTSYFVYVNGDQHFENGMLEEATDKGIMKFDVQLIEYIADSSWVEEKILNLKSCLEEKFVLNTQNLVLVQKEINNVSMLSYFKACKSIIYKNFHSYTTLIVAIKIHNTSIK